MRRLARASTVKQLFSTAADSTSLATPGCTAASRAGPEAKAAGLSNRTFPRFFSQSRLAQSGAAEGASQQSPPYILYGAVGAAGLGMITYYVSRQPHDSAVSPVVFKTDTPSPPSDSVEIGEFHVQDHLGMHFTQDELLGNFAVLYFGKIGDEGRKTRLLQMADAVMESDRKSNMHYLTPVFVTMDPKADDVIKMNEMVEDYATALNRKSILHVRLKGLSGEDNFKLHERAQRYTSIVKAKGGVETSPDTATRADRGDLYFVNPEGEFIASYGPDAAPKAIAAEWSEIMKAYKLAHPTWHGPKAVKERHA